jgi:hypothetical protein
VIGSGGNSESSLRCLAQNAVNLAVAVVAQAPCTQDKNDRSAVHK